MFICSVYVLTFALSISQKIDHEAEAHVQEAVAFALSGSELPPEELYTDIFTSTPNELVRGCDPFTYGASISAN